MEDLVAKKLDPVQVEAVVRDVVRTVLTANGGDPVAADTPDNPLTASGQHFDSVSSEEATVMIGVQLGVSIDRNPFFSNDQKPAASFDDIVKSICEQEYEEREG
ncbi:MAG: hypothetical protein R3F59_25645 [Myxococcota bacterium]